MTNEQSALFGTAEAYQHFRNQPEVKGGCDSVFANE
jgi:hypothetical protein